MSKPKWILLTLLLVALLVAGCAMQVRVVTPTPAQVAQASPAPETTAAVPTDTPTPVSPAPTDTPTLTPRPTDTPTPMPPTATDTPTPTPAPSEGPEQPTPAPRINLKEVGDRLWGLSSFAFEIEAPKAKLQGEWVRVPQSWHIRFVEEDAPHRLEYVVIGERKWAVLNVSPTPIAMPCPESSSETAFEMGKIVQDACALGAEILPLVMASLDLPYERDARFVSKSALDDGTLTHMYEWQEEDGPACRLHIDPSSGIPVAFDCDELRYRLSHLNDPANVIRPPTSEMPEKLHIDDARMALNSLSNFRYRSTQEFTSTEGTFAHYSEGVYVQVNQAWKAKFGEVGDEPFIEFLFHPSIGETLLKGGDITMWFPVSWDEGSEKMAKNAAPFAFWPNPPKEHRIGVLQRGSTRSVAGQECNEYLFTWAGSGDYGEAEVQLRLCVTPEEMVPLRLHATASLEDGTRLVRTLELSHINDPTNVVEPPEEYIASSTER